METNTLLKRILVVEDEAEISEILQKVLSPICDSVLTASNGVDALAVLKANPEICAVLSDISMPQMTGLELLYRIRTDFNPVPFVILTGFGDTANYHEAVKLNATDFLEKPFDLNEVVKVMTRATDYGFQLIQAERSLEEIYRDSGIPQEKLALIKRAKRTVMAMRIESSLYLKK